jgi:hypothetical protein
MKLKLKSKELGRRLRRQVRVLDQNRFFASCWNGPTPSQDYFVSRESPRFFFNAEASETYLKVLKTAFPESIGAITKRAARAASHTFNLLGSGETLLGPKIDWHKDFKSGQRWPKLHFTKIRIINPYDNSDVKIPWELSRLQFLTDLGRGHWLEEGSIYKREFISVLNDWMVENPVDVGVNWVCSMEVAIRAVNIIWGMHFFKFDLSELEFLRNVIRLLYYHGLHIERNLEITADGANSNHLISNYLGLFYIGLLFPQFDRSTKWKKMGLEGLESEMQAQVFPDGADYEGSTSYHRLVLEMFLSAFFLGKVNGLGFSDAYRERLLKMLQFSEAVTASSGYAPLMGDNDDGFLIKISTENPADHRPLIDVGLPALGERGFADIPASEERLWYLGPGFVNFPGVPRKPASRIFKDSGYAIIRNDNIHILFNAAGVPPGNFGGHKHNDLLSFTLELHGIAYLIDPGTFCYSADYNMRNLSRSTGYHNTVTIDAEEQNRFFQQRLFYLADDARPRIEQFSEERSKVVVSGSHDGYARMGDGIIHRRTIIVSLETSGISVVDEFEGKRGRHHAFDLRFITPIDSVERNDGTGVTIRRDHVRSLVIGTSEDGLTELSVQPLSYFPRYGVKADANLVRFSFRSKLPFKITTSLAYNDSYADLRTRLRILGQAAETDVAREGVAV